MDQAGHVPMDLPVVPECCYHLERRAGVGYADTTKCHAAGIGQVFNDVHPWPMQKGSLKQAVMCVQLVPNYAIQSMILMGWRGCRSHLQHSTQKRMTKELADQRIGLPPPACTSSKQPVCHYSYCPPVLPKQSAANSAHTKALHQNAIYILL